MYCSDNIVQSLCLQKLSWKLEYTLNNLQVINEIYDLDPPLHAHSTPKEEKLRYEGVWVSFTEPLTRRLRRKMSARLCGFTREREPGGSFPRGKAPRAAWLATARGSRWGRGAPRGSPDASWQRDLRTGPPEGFLLPWRVADAASVGAGAAPATSARGEFAGSGVKGPGAAGGWTNRTASPCPLLTRTARCRRPRRGPNPERAMPPARPAPAVLRGDVPCAKVSVEMPFPCALGFSRAVCGSPGWFLSPRPGRCSLARAHRATSLPLPARPASSSHLRLSGSRCPEGTRGFLVVTPSRC